MPGKKVETKHKPNTVIDVSSRPISQPGAAQDPANGETDLDELTPLSLPDDPTAPIARFFIRRKSTRSRQSKDNSNFHKPNPLVHNKPQSVLTVTQQKITNILLRHAQQSEPVNADSWKMPISEMLAALKISTRNTQHLEKMIDEMMSIKVRWDTLEEQGVAKHFSVVFPHTKLYAGEITFKVEKEAIEFLEKNQSYTNLDLDEISNLTKVCSVPLYELSSRYLGIGGSRWLDWEELRDMLLASDRIPVKAKMWRGFSERYLTEAVKDINSSTKLFIEIETERYRSKVKSVRIKVSRQKNPLDTMALLSTSDEKSSLHSAMLAIGMLDKNIFKTLSTYPSDEIKAALSHTKWRMNNPALRKLQYPNRFFLTSLKQGHYKDYGNVTGDLFPVIEGSPVEDSQRPAPDSERKSNGRAKLFATVQKQRLFDVKVILAELKKDELTVLYEEFNAGKPPGMFITHGRKNRAGVLPTFQNWYAKKLWGEVTDKEIVETMERMLNQHSK